MPAQSAIPDARQKIMALKGQINPETGKIYTDAETGQVFGRTAAWVRYMVKTMPRENQICPKCLRKLDV